MPYNVVQTYPTAAKLAMVNLARQGFDHFNPLCRDKVVRNGRVGWRVGQMFPSYMFVRSERRWRPLMNTVGVARLLMAESEKPAEIPDSFVDDLKSRMNEQGLVVLTNAKFVMGQQLELRQGSSSFDVLFDGQKSRDRVYVLMNMLGTLRRAEVNERDLYSLAG